MANSTAFLQGQLEAYSESWKAPHVDAMECWDVSDRVQTAIFLFELIQERDRHWAESVRYHGKQFDEADARTIGNLYEWWLKACAGTMRLIRDVELKNYEVKGAAQFRRAYHEVRAILSIPLDRVLQATSE